MTWIHLQILSADYRIPIESKHLVVLDIKYVSHTKWQTFCFVFGMSQVQILAILTEVFCGCPQSLQINAGKVP
jgi:hypothetical protein